MNKQNTQKGIALYTAIIVASIVLLLAVAMADIAFRQLVLSRTSLNSQHAFYIANSAVECGLYYDVRENLFPSNEDEGDDFRDDYSAGAINEMECADQTVAYADIIDIQSEENGGVGSATTTFQLNNITSNPTSCAVVTVGKHEEDTGSYIRTGTILLVDGRYPCDGPGSTERSIRVRYGFPNN